jgi:DNA-binding response OmpR family regulator
MLKRIIPSLAPAPETRPILVVDDDISILHLVRKTLTQDGFDNVLTAVDVPTATKLVETCNPVLAIVDLDLGPNAQNGLELIRLLHGMPNGPIPVVLSGNRSQEQFFKAARAGAVDFFIKGPKINISAEIRRLLDGKRGLTQDRTLPQIVSNLGYLRSFGLTPGEMAVLTAFAEDFPKLSELAARKHQHSIQLRKTFSRIYEKLDILDMQQLVRILTICELFNNEN